MFQRTYRVAHLLPAAGNVPECGRDASLCFHGLDQPQRGLDETGYDANMRNLKSRNPCRKIFEQLGPRSRDESHTQDERNPSLGQMHVKSNSWERQSVHFV